MSLSAAPPSGDAALRVVFVIGGMGALSGLWLGGGRRRSPRELLGVAILLRFLFFPLLPGLSDDGYRYVWDGLLVADGANPYLAAPADVARGSAEEIELYPLLNSTEYFSVYPPVSQSLFGMGARLGIAWGWSGIWYAIKALILAVELAAVWWLARSRPDRSIALYAWNPLVAFEVAGQAHTEALMVGGLALMLGAEATRRGRTAIAGFGVAVWAKLYPMLLLPGLLRRVGGRRVWVLALLSAVLWMPFWDAAVPGNVLASLSLYVAHFEFAAAPYFGLKGAAELLTGQDWDREVAGALQVVLVLGLLVLFALDARRKWALARVSGVALTAFLLCATTVHPWYLLGPLFLFAAAGVTPTTERAWLWLSAAMLATYLRYTHGDAPYLTATWVGWGGWVVLLAGPALVRAVLRRRGAAKWGWIRQSLPGPPGRLLDLGAGEGYVAVAAARDGWRVDVADVVDYRAVDLPVVPVDGGRLAVASGVYDATVIVFVLHHADAPLAVLREARRVTSGPLVVVESVYRSEAERRWLCAADRLSNRLRPGSGMDKGTLAPQPAAVWRVRFEAEGFRITHEEEAGGPWHRRHLFVLQPHEPAGTGADA